MKTFTRFGRRRFLGGLAVSGAALTVGGCVSASPSGQPLAVGLIGPLAGRSAASTEAIQRGMLLAVDDLTQKGGLLGRPVEIVVRDSPNDARIGRDVLGSLLQERSLLAVFGGIYSPVMLGQLDLIHQAQLPLINPWGSLTTRKPGILADTTAWGRNNLEGFTFWLQHRGIPAVDVQLHDQGETNLVLQARALRDAGADCVLMVADTAEGAAFMRARVAWLDCSSRKSLGHQRRPLPGARRGRKR